MTVMLWCDTCQDFSQRTESDNCGNEWCIDCGQIIAGNFNEIQKRGSVTKSKTVCGIPFESDYFEKGAPIYSNIQGEADQISYREKEGFIPFLRVAFQAYESFSKDLLDNIIDRDDLTAEQKIEWIHTALANIDKLLGLAQVEANKLIK